MKLEMEGETYVLKKINKLTFESEPIQGMKPLINRVYKSIEINGEFYSYIRIPKRGEIFRDAEVLLWEGEDLFVKKDKIYIWKILEL